MTLGLISTFGAKRCLCLSINVETVFLSSCPFFEPQIKYFTALAFNRTKPLSPRLPSRKPLKRAARTSLCHIWKHAQSCFPPFGQKPRESKINCFLNEQAPREQAAINELTKKTPRRRATTTTSMAGLGQKRRNETEIGRRYTASATGMVVFATYIYVPLAVNSLTIERPEFNQLN